MGEVYRAHDTKLNRDVAIKVLPEGVANDRERLARFRREAQVLASLNHPNIGAIYGFEDSGDIHALVMELVEGPTLADRLVQGPVPINEALALAKQIADALQLAHQQGVIHRDLKPANIKVRDDGTVKVLDFGLAKLVGPADAVPVQPDGREGRLQADLTASRAVTSPAMMTGVGLILGTAPYMAPEQATGRQVDQRADIWAFGCVLYELLTGRRAFDGDNVGETISNILKSEPDWNALPVDSPAHVRLLIRRCLEKDRGARLADVAVVRFLLDDGAGVIGPPHAHPPAPDGVSVLPQRTRFAQGWALVVGGVVTGATVWLLRSPPASRVTRTSIDTSDSATLSLDGITRDLAISPDGSRIVYIGNNNTQLFVRALDALAPTAIVTAASAGLRDPFISPDGQWVGYAEGLNTLKRVAITGGPSTMIANLDGASRGAAWLPDQTIVFATLGATGLQRVSASGGTPAVLTRADRARGELDHLWPRALPGGQQVLFTITAGGGDAAQVAALDLRTHATTVLVRGGSDGQYVADGYLLFAAAGTLRAARFDARRLVVGQAVPLAAQVAMAANGGANVSASANGTLVYADSAGLAAGARTMVWVDRAGNETPVRAQARPYVTPSLSPDGTRIVACSTDEEIDLWLSDLRRGTLSRLTFDPGVDIAPVWTQDGRRIIFTSDRGGAPNLWWLSADGTGAAEQLTTGDQQQRAGSVTPDGLAVVFSEQRGSGFDLMRVDLAGEHRPQPVLQNTFVNRNPMISPDGHWLAYESNASGHFEVYVRPYPNVAGGQWQVSTAGGTRPLWARSSRELFFTTDIGRLTRVAVETAGAGWNTRAPTSVFSATYFLGSSYPQRMYDVSPDDQQFLMIKSRTDATRPPGLVIVQHFDEELKGLALAK